MLIKFPALFAAPVFGMAALWVLPDWRTRWRWMLVAGASVLALLLAALVARNVTRPIGELVAGVLDVARGRFGREVKVAGRNELGDLAYSFNHMSRELASYDQENRRLIAALEQGYLDTIRSLAAAVDAKDPYTRGHAQRVAALSVEIGRELGLGRDALQALEYGGILHDIGKIGIPDSILHNAGPLPPEGLRYIHDHPIGGENILKPVGSLGRLCAIVRHHHEKWNGQGYPDGLYGHRVDISAQGCETKLVPFAYSRPGAQERVQDGCACIPLGLIEHGGEVSILWQQAPKQDAAEDGSEALGPPFVDMVNRAIDFLAPRFNLSDFA